MNQTITYEFVRQAIELTQTKDPSIKHNWKKYYIYTGIGDEKLSVKAVYASLCELKGEPLEVSDFSTAKAIRHLKDYCIINAVDSDNDRSYWRDLILQKLRSKQVDANVILFDLLHGMLDRDIKEIGLRSDWWEILE